MLEVHVGDGPLARRHTRRPQPVLRLPSDRTVEQVCGGVDVSAAQMAWTSVWEAASGNEPLLRAQSIKVETHQLPLVALRDRAREGPDARFCVGFCVGFCV